MDEIVLQALRKWPNVPSVFGWLSLDRRGNWAIKGERVRHQAIVDFIGRNYARDDQGRWYFQNGPQRVFVRLAYTPMVYRTAPGGQGLGFTAHTAAAVREVQRAWLDEHGFLLLETDLGFGVVHDQDLPDVLGRLFGPDNAPLGDAAIEALLDAAAGADTEEGIALHTAAGPVPVFTVLSDEVAQRFGFDPDPRPAPGEPEC
jgi:hypothetical protein